MWRGGGGVTLLNPKYPPAVPAGGYNKTFWVTLFCELPKRSTHMVYRAHKNMYKPLHTYTNLLGWGIVLRELKY